MIPVLLTKPKEQQFEYTTSKLKLNIHFKHNLITVEKLKQYLVPKHLIDAFCKGEYNQTKLACKNYGNCYSCPPYAPSFEEIKSKNPFFVLMNAYRTLSPLMYKYGQWLERTIGGKDMIDGRCRLCKPCRLQLGEPCRYPSKRRSSLEALGIHASKLAKEVLNHKIQWYRRVNGKLVIPEYVTVIHGLLTNSFQLTLFGGENSKWEG